MATLVLTGKVGMCAQLEAERQQVMAELEAKLTGAAEAAAAAASAADGASTL